MTMMIVAMERSFGKSMKNYYACFIVRKLPIALLWHELLDDLERNEGSQHLTHISNGAHRERDPNQREHDTKESPTHCWRCDIPITWRGRHEENQVINTLVTAYIWHHLFFLLTKTAYIIWHNFFCVNSIVEIVKSGFCAHCGI